MGERQAEIGGGERAALERVLAHPVPLWTLLLAILLMAAVAIGFGSIVDGWEKSGRIGRVAITLARVPDTLKKIAEGPAPIFHGAYEKRAGGFTRASDFTDPGYELISAFDPAKGRSTVRLLRLADGVAVREITPDVDAANAASHFRSALTDVRRDKDAARNRLMHPLLLGDGSVILHDSSPLARYDTCGRVLWSLDGIFHHSTELGPDGSLWVPYRYPVPREPRVPRPFGTTRLPR